MAFTFREAIQLKKLSISLITESPTNITKTSATLNGDLTSLGGESMVKVWFEYGQTSEYGNTTEKETKAAAGLFSAAITGLEEKTSYHFRACASKSDDSGIVYGSDMIFSTLSTITGSGLFFCHG